MSLLGSVGINLPPLVFAHATFMCVLGLRSIFSRPKRAPAAGKIADTSMLGILQLAIGLCYLTTSYMPIEENQFLHASVRVRIGLAALAGLRLFIGPPLSEDGRRDMLIVCVYDGIGGIGAGWELGVWNGRAPGL